MTAVTTLPWSRPLTRADLESMPDDGHRYELLDGVLIVSPAPRPVHQRAVGRLALRLTEACLSPSSRRIDLLLKHSRLEAAGCPTYWVVDPDEPSLTAWELCEGRYVQTGAVTGSDSYEASTPFPVRITPAELVSSR